VQTAREALAKNRRDAMDIAEKVGGGRIRAQLRDAEGDLIARLRMLDPGMKGTFTEQQMRATLAQVRHVLRGLRPGMQRAVVDTGLEAADTAAGGVVTYLETVDRQFRGTGSQPLALDEASMLDSARYGAKASILRRIATSGEEVEGAEDVPSMGKLGVLDRYGVNVIDHFEGALRTGLIARKPWESVKADLVAGSPFLQGAPASWAERIVRTETMGAYNRAGLESMQEADDQLGDLVKILSATFDDRTAADSYAVHGQIRRSTEPFETWYGPMQHPPARPNDREIVVPHRVSWPLPPYLAPKDRGAVVSRWIKEKKKGSPPETPPDTTVPRSLFGKQAPPRIPPEGGGGGAQGGETGEGVAEPQGA